MGVKATAHSGQRRIFFILDRATRKLPGEMGLWMQYIEYARKQKSYKKLQNILLNVLRLHPTRSELWAYGAEYALEEHADMTQARGYMQRGLRFCKSSRTLWLEYAYIEMLYIAKIIARRRILGLDKERESASQAQDQQEIDFNADTVTLPQVTEEDINPGSDGEDDEANKAALQKLKSSPALSGAIPMAIFDAAMTQFDNNESIARDFYTQLSTFTNLPCLQTVLGHVVEHMIKQPSPGVHAQVCYITLPCAGIEADTAAFPRAFGTTWGRIKECNGLDRTELSREIAQWLKPLAQRTDLNPSLHQVLVSIFERASASSGLS